MSQLTIFPEVKHIPQWIANHFNRANAGNYTDKQLFYTEIKPVVLEKYASKAGWDKQTIIIKCNSCSGTGIYYNKVKCWNCNNGVYAIRTFYLKRYILNGIIYHIPQTENPKEPVINDIKGRIEHEKTNPGDAFISFLIISYFYNKKLLIDTCVRYLKKDFIPYKIKELMQKLLSRKKLNENDLPF